MSAPHSQSVHGPKVLSPLKQRVHILTQSPLENSFAKAVQELRSGMKVCNFNLIDLHMSCFILCVSRIKPEISDSRDFNQNIQLAYKELQNKYKQDITQYENEIKQINKEKQELIKDLDVSIAKTNKAKTQFETMSVSHEKMTKKLNELETTVVPKLQVN